MEGRSMWHRWSLNYQSMVIILVAERMMACGDCHVVALIVLRVMSLPPVDDLAVVVVI